jgi:hypothetical protein
VSWLWLVIGAAAAGLAWQLLPRRAGVSVTGGPELAAALKRLDSGDAEPLAALLDATHLQERSLYLDMAAPQLTLAAVVKTVSSHPNRASSHLLEAWVQLQEGRPDDARPALDRALELAPRDPTSSIGLLRWSSAVHEGTDNAFMLFQRADKLCPGHTGLYRALVQALSRKHGGNNGKMFTFVRAVAEQAPEGSVLPALVLEAHLYQMADIEKPRARRNYAEDDAMHAETVRVFERAFGDGEIGRDANLPLLMAALAWFEYTGQNDLRVHALRILGDRWVQPGWPEGDAGAGVARARHQLI